MPTMAKKCDEVGVTLAPMIPSTNPGMTICEMPEKTVAIEIRTTMRCMDFFTMVYAVSIGVEVGFCFDLAIKKYMVIPHIIVRMIHLKSFKNIHS